MKKRKWDKETRRHKTPSNGDRTTCRLEKKKKIGRKKEELGTKDDETKQQNGSEYFTCCI